MHHGCHLADAMSGPFTACGTPLYFDHRPEFGAFCNIRYEEQPMPTLKSVKPMNFL